MYMVTIRAIHWVPSGLVCLDPPPAHRTKSTFNLVKLSINTTNLMILILFYSTVNLKYLIFQRST